MDNIDFADHTDIAFRNIEETRAGENRLLRVKGLIFHSSVVAEYIELHHEVDSVNILVWMAPTRPNKSGLFDLYIPITERTKQITFGVNKKLLWQRGATHASESPVQIIAEQLA
ncbi:hypothetical protein [Duganella sp. BuS-21]|uniref:hypothetical protein n=1 Tax=Duganella sp. BuS-21 TaxID=2943848 RepID=UPI0035A71BDE